MSYNPHDCIECLRPIRRLFGETSDQHNKRIYCSRQCVQAWQKRHNETAAKRHAQAEAT